MCQWAGTFAAVGCNDNSKGQTVCKAFSGMYSALRFSLRISLAAVLVATIGFVAPAEANPKYAAIVIDANSGKTLFASSADAARYPASLTKMMTLYMVFEAMAAGKITKNSRVRFSAQAAARPPTKLGVKAGGSITVEQAIYALVTKSANDVATAVAETLGGTEENFARMMTSKARRLGMTSTTFRNASGLPDPGQRTTARDMATLGLALREHYPSQYAYFSTRSFTFGKSRMANHNKLLGRVKGVDGIKTGYIRASGFNLVTSVSDGNRRLVAVVMGGQSGRSRDDHMAALIRTHLPKATPRRGGALVASKTIDVQDATPVAVAALTLPRKGAPTPDTRPDLVAQQVDRVVEEEQPAPVARTPEIDPVSTASVKADGEWVIQVASLPSQPEAIATLTSMADRAPGILGRAKGFTETFEHKGSTFYRARFAGFGSKTAAWNACSALKKQKISCFAVQN